MTVEILGFTGTTTATTGTGTGGIDATGESVAALVAATAIAILIWRAAPGRVLHRLLSAGWQALRSRPRRIALGSAALPLVAVSAPALAEDVAPVPSPLDRGSPEASRSNQPAGAEVRESDAPGRADPSSPPARVDPVPRPTDRRPVSHLVTVGDTLWDIAAAELGPDVPNADITARWRDWWAANRDVIGPNPHLIHPGQVLTQPALPSTPEARP